MRPIINCINMMGGSIPAHISEILGICAISMFQNSKPTFEIKGEDFGGLIKSEFRDVSFIGISGMLFEAELEYETDDKQTRKIKNQFIVTKGVLAINYSEGYDFISKDFEELKSEINKELETIIQDYLKKRENDSATMN